MNARDYLIYCDMDGTLLSEWSLGPTVPKANMDALKAFIQAGGAVSIATGRQHADTLSFFEGIRFSAPLVLNNGSYIYDQNEKRVIHREPLPSGCVKEAVELVKQHDDLWVVAADEERIYQLSESPEKDVRTADGFPRRMLDESSFLSLDAGKLCYICAGASRMSALWEAVNKMETRPLIAGFQSSPIYLEVVKKGVSKATGIRKAAVLAGLTGRKLVCIGDYLNDYDMLKMADIAACPANAAREVLEICQIVTRHHNEGAFADLLTKLP
ncbi:MAG: Cof-type HAD-IIB family hydrolase [Eubacteriales bacterium]|nr:Cof-type HAD-IIB family hydrolase [Eubacteriales bacterium]